MQKAEQLRILDGLIAHRNNGTNVDAGHQARNPVSAYTSPEIAEQEWQTFFNDYPQLLGLSADLPKNGTFFTSNDVGKPILCTRDKAGQFHAFLNVCRHRGTVVENAERGEKRLFSCPFHAWGYSDEGKLVAVPNEDQFGPVDRECNSLVELPSEERHGLLWVSPNPDVPLDLAAQLGDLDAELESWRLDRYVRHGGTRFDHAMNWKLAIDTFGETYHFNALHKDTLAQSFHGNCQLYQTYERNHRMMLCLKNIDSLREEPREDWHVLKGALPVYYLFPNTQLIIGGEGPTLVRVYPDGANPNQSWSQIGFYLDPQFVSRQESEDKAANRDVRNIAERMEGFADVIREEDYVAAASSHVGALSGAQDYVTFGRNEPALHHYHDTYRDALGLPPLERISN